MLLKAGSPRTLGLDEPLVAFGEEPKRAGAWAGRRLLFIDDAPAFELSFWCGTCPFTFRRLEGAKGTLSRPELEGRLTDGLDDLDDSVVAAFDVMLAKGTYLPLLLSVEPRLVSPVKPGDYYAEEQVTTWGVSAFWGLPENPQTPYYRTFETSVSPDAHLYEFVVPMVPPSWNDPAKVAEHAARLIESATPTVVAVSTLDVCAPAVDNDSTDYHQHWGLTHFLLDGHHKMHAAADAARPLRLLSLLSLDASLALPEQVTRVPELRTQPASPRAVS